MRNDFVVTSFGTKTPEVFARCVDKLCANLDELKVPHDIDLIEPVSSRDPRKYACLYRPTFLLHKFYRHQKTLIQVDVDTKFLSADLFPTGFMYDQQDWDVGICRNGKTGQFSKLPYIVFYMVIRHTQGGWNFLKTWEMYCEQNWPQYHDHQRLMWAIATANTRFKDLTTFLDGKAIKNGFAEGNDQRTNIFKAKTSGSNFSDDYLT